MLKQFLLLQPALIAALLSLNPATPLMASDIMTTEGNEKRRRIDLDVIQQRVAEIEQNIAQKRADEFYGFFLQEMRNFPILKKINNPEFMVRRLHDAFYAEESDHTLMYLYIKSSAEHIIGSNAYDSAHPNYLYFFSLVEELAPYCTEYLNLSRALARMTPGN